MAEIRISEDNDGRWTVFAPGLVITDLTREAAEAFVTKELLPAICMVLLDAGEIEPPPEGTQYDQNGRECAMMLLVSTTAAVALRFAREDARTMQGLLVRLGGVAPADARLLLDEGPEDFLRALTDVEAQAPFDLEQGPLLRVRLLRLADDDHTLLVTMHHIVSDGWSMGVLMKELSTLYKAFLYGENDPLPELEIQYADYAAWQREWIEGEVLQQQAAYWKTRLAGAPGLLEVPTDYPRPVEQDFAGESAESVLGEELTAGLRELSRRHGTTLYMTLLAAWAALLGRLAGQQDVVIGSPVANRGRAEIENLIGFFVNTLALRFDLSGSLSVAELLTQTKQQVLAA